MKTTKLEEQEAMLLAEDGIFGRKHRETFDHAECCASCGFELLSGEEAMEVGDTGELIHKSCWNEYADENAERFGKTFLYGEGEIG